MTAESIAAALDGRRDRSGRWRAHCPVHQGKSRSLSIKQSGDTVLVYCFGGCNGRDVIDCLRGLGLWPALARRDLTTEEKRAWGRAQRDHESASAWARSAAALAETVLDDMGYTAERAGLERVLAISRHGGAELLAEFREWRSTAPELTQAMVKAGQNSSEHIERNLAALIAEWGRVNAAA